jgi:dihydroflavonol-4-reductase
MVLVTGGTGLVGSHLLYDLLCRGYEVKVLVRATANKDNILTTFRYYSTQAEELFDKIHWVVGDILDLQSLEEVFSGIDYVYHTAAFVSFKSSDKQRILETNIEGTANIVNLCLGKGIKKLCFVSSIASLGTSENGDPVTEGDVWKPTKKETAYSFSKYKSEMEVWRGITEGLNAVIVNPSVILGPGDGKSGSNAVVDMIAKGFPYYTSGVTGFVDVRDVSRAMILLMESEISGERFILSAENIAYRKLFTTMAEALQVTPPHKLVSKWIAFLVPLFSTKISKEAITISFKKLYYSSEKIHKALNFNFQPFNKTVTDLALHYKNAMDL